MKKTNQHIEIVRSNVSGLGSMSQKSCDAISAVLTKHYAKVGVTTISDMRDLEALVISRPDMVFLGVKFLSVGPDFNPRSASKIWVCQYLDKCGIAYTGSDQAALELENNKHLAKQRVLDTGLKTPPFYVARRHQPLPTEIMHLKFPLFVKPTNGGGGLGIDSDSVARNFDELMLKIRSVAAEQQSDSLLEEYLPGREFSVAILKDERANELLALPIELVAEPDEHGMRLLSRQIKSSNTESVLEVVDENIRSSVCALAIDVFHALGARDYGRVDIRLDESGRPQFLEANLKPSLIQGYGSFPKACMLNMNMGYESMILSITRLGLARSLSTSQYADEVSAGIDVAKRPLKPVFKPV